MIRRWRETMQDARLARAAGFGWWTVLRGMAGLGLRRATVPQRDSAECEDRHSPARLVARMAPGLPMMHDNCDADLSRRIPPGVL